MIKFLKHTYAQTRSIIKKLMLKYYRMGINSRVNAIRRKEHIDVLFLLYDLSKWKTENLFLLMLNHPRFNPHIELTIRVCDTPSEIAKKTTILRNYLDAKGYDYIENTLSVQNKYDVILYQEPYSEALPDIQNVYHNPNSLFISICYSSHTSMLPFEFYEDLHFFAWFDCYENILAANNAKQIIGKRRNNILVTGLPFIEQLLTAKADDPWKKIGNKRRIIWAPHHSIGNMQEAIYYSTFLNIYDFMLELAYKYSSQTQWAFKPHPLLKMKLEQVWGKEKTDAYYNKWQNLENGQLEYGDYIGLFQHSDAMLHDCSSFIVEYLCINKPVLFLNEDPKIREELNEYGRKALDVAEIHSTKDAIEEFVLRVIHGEDLKFMDRQEFISNYLLPNRKASANILNAILGKFEAI